MVFRGVEQAFARYDLDRRDACPTILLERLILESYRSAGGEQRSARVRGRVSDFEADR